MSDGKTWVTPSQAIKEMAGKLPQVDTNALLYWARDGKIQIQCHEVTCSDDGGLSMYIADNIPNDFWHDAVTNCKPNWTAGELTVQMEVDEGSFEQWTASGLKIELAGLQQAIKIEIGQTDQKPKCAAKKRWQQQRLTQQQADALKFIDIAITNQPKTQWVQLPCIALISSGTLIRKISGQVNRSGDLPSESGKNAILMGGASATV